MDEIAEQTDNQRDGRRSSEETTKLLDRINDLVKDGASVRAAVKQISKESGRDEEILRHQYLRYAQQNLINEAGKAVVDDHPATFERAYNELESRQRRGTQGQWHISPKMKSGGL